MFNALTPSEKADATGAYAFALAGYDHVSDALALVGAMPAGFGRDNAYIVIAEGQSQAGDFSGALRILTERRERRVSRTRA